MTGIERTDEDVVAFAVVADAFAVVVGTLVTAVVPVTAVPLGSVAPTLVELVTANIALVVALLAVAGTAPFVMRAELALSVGVVAVVAGTTVPAASGAPTPMAPAVTRDEVAAVAADDPLDTDVPDATALPAITTPPPPPPPTPPVTATSP